MTTKALQPGSLILITGVNGFIAGEIAKQLVEQGYRVRGTARDQAKLDIVAKAFEHKQGAFEGVIVKDMTVEGALENIATGVDGIIHVASDVSFGADPNVVVTPTVNAMNSFLKVAARQPQVKRFVYTSSSIAVMHNGTEDHPVTEIITKDSWNTVDVEKAWAPAPYEQDRAVSVYAASKVAAEKAGWDFVKQDKPGFVYNVVNPAFVLGPLAFPGQNGSTGGWLAAAYQGHEQSYELLKTLLPVWSVDVRDIGRLHVAALLEPDLANERLLGHAQPTSFRDLAKIFDKINPDNIFKVPEDNREDRSKVDTALSQEVLRRHGGQGFIQLEQTLRDQLAQ